MNVVFLSPSGTIGGAERVLLHLFDAVGMAFPDADRTVIQLGDGPLADEAERRGVRAIVESASKSFAGIGDSRLQRTASRTAGIAAAGVGLVRAAPQLLSLTARIRRRLSHLRPTIVHSNGMKTHLLSRLTTPRGVPRILHLHDFFSNRPLVRRATPFLAASAARGIAISHAVAKDVHSLVPSMPISVVHNAVDTDHFSPGDPEPHSLDKKAGLATAAPGTLRVGLVATYADWKGHGVFLQALSRVPNVRGYIVGGPIYATSGSQVTLEELQRMADSLGLRDRVGFLPFQSDPRDVYRSLDVVVHASTRPEPFGLTITEAMSVGRPVVVAADGGAVELFEDCVSAIGYSAGDVGALSRAMERLFHDSELRRRIGAAARSAAVANFSLSRFNREVAEVFDCGRRHNAD
jgi:glycosyltransferase involved in cell wall biosynthesis